MDIQSILMLIQAFTEHSLTELNVEEGGVKVCLKREAGAVGAPVMAVTGGETAGAAAAPLNPAAGTGAVVPAAAGVPTVPMTAAPAVPAAAVPPVPVVGVPAAAPAGGLSAAGVAVPGVVPVAVPAVGAVPAAAPMTGVPAVGAVAAVPQAAQVQEGIDSDNVVVSPLVGIFYSAPSPEADNFVKVGDRVKKGQVLGIIEAMKLMNEIESEYDGVVEAILVKNEEVVEFGQPLFRIR